MADDSGEGSTLLQKKVLVPAVLGVGALAAGKAKGPQLVQGLTDTLDGARERAESKVGEKALDAGKKTRRLPIQHWTDVAVPVETAYKAWSDFESYPKFMQCVVEVEKTSRNKVRFEEKIWFSRREWEAQITERRTNDRIVWKTTSGVSHHGVVSFHKLEPNLTRVMVGMEFEPNGMVEELASRLGFVNRAVQSDLARFKAYVEMEDAKGIEYGAVSDDASAPRNKDGGRDDEKDEDADEAPTRSGRKS